MNRVHKQFLFLFSLVLIAQSTLAQDRDPGAAPEHRTRLLGIGINEGSVGFEKAFDAARSAGVQFVEIPNAWDDIEQAPGEFSNKWLDIADAYYPAVNVNLVISLNPIDTNKLRKPADLRDKRFDDPEAL